MATSSGTKYSISPEVRQRLRQEVRATTHAEVRHRERAPQQAADIAHALEHVRLDPTIVAHPFWSERPDDDGSTDAAAVYRGRTVNGDVYSMIYPIVDDDHRPPLAVTSYRLRSVREYGAGWGLADDISVALEAYLRTLSQQGGIVDE